MRKLYYLGIVVLLFGACNGVDKLYAEGKDRQLIEKVMKREMKRNAKEKELRLVEDAFERVQGELLDELAYLNKREDDAKWVRIYDLADKIDDLQRRVKSQEPVIAKNGYVAQFEYLEVRELKEKSGYKAAEYLAIRGNEKLDAAKKLEKPFKMAREAHNDLSRVKGYSRSYDVSRELEQAKKLGTMRVATQIGADVGYRNVSFNTSYSGRVRQELERMANGFDSKWIKHVHGSPIGQTDLDYIVKINLDDVDVRDRGQQTSSREYRDQVREKVRDANGHVVVDSLGNAIYTYRDVEATVRTTTHRVEAEAELSFTILNAKTMRPVKTRYYDESDNYEDEFCTIYGDEEALPSSVRCRDTTIDLPDEDEMVEDLLRDMRSQVRSAIKRELEALD